MNYEIVELTELSGKEASIYSVIIEDDAYSLYDRFLIQYQEKYSHAIKDIQARIRTMANKTGARDIYFKGGEGAPGDGVCALFDLPDFNLRLYCIRYGLNLIILGGGGPKNVRAWQDDKKLSSEVKKLMKISKAITKRMMEKDIYWSNDKMHLLGELNFNDDEE